MLFLKKKNKTINHFFPENFIDIHSHLLPGIDDGVKTINESIKIVEKLQSLGIRNIITTPHVMGDIYPNSTKTIINKLNAVKKELTERKISDISINAAAEYMLDQQFYERLKRRDLLTIKDNFILVELSYFEAPVNLYEILFEIKVMGYKPILAHPERYNFFHNDINNYYQLKKRGCLFQLNILSLTNHYGKGVNKMTMLLLKEKLYDFLGTDIHHIRHYELTSNLLTKKNKKLINHLLINNLNLLTT
jgi:tyrosine-protein phosphatase YwqE